MLGFLTAIIFMIFYKIICTFYILLVLLEKTYRKNIAKENYSGLFYKLTINI